MCQRKQNAGLEAGSERRRFPVIGYCRIPQAGALGKYLLAQIDEPRFAEGAKQRVLDGIP